MDQDVGNRGQQPGLEVPETVASRGKYLNIIRVTFHPED